MQPRFLHAVVQHLILISQGMNGYNLQYVVSSLADYAKFISTTICVVLIDSQCIFCAIFLCFLT